MNDILRLEITDLCNLKCKMCWSKNWNHLEMEWRQLKKLVYNFKESGGRCIVLTSREPLLSKNFNNILRLCSVLAIELKSLTNGTLISDDVAKNIVQCDCLNYIAISLHGNEKHHDEIVGVDGAYSKVISSLNFLNYYLIVSEKVGKQNAGANWAEYVEYGTTDDIIIELQNIGLPRHLSMMIKDDYIDFLTFEDGMLVDLNARELIENIDCKKYKSEIDELKEMIL